jgi:hypothetical protein
MPVSLPISKISRVQNRLCVKPQVSALNVSARGKKLHLVAERLLRMEHTKDTAPKQPKRRGGGSANG